MKKAPRRLSPKSLSIAYWFTLVSFIVPIVYLIVRIILNAPNSVAHRTDADYVLMIVQCLLGIFVLHLPGMLSKRLRFQVPPTMYILYILFLYCAIFLGEVRNFYYHIPHWDVILHCFSSVMTGLFGFMVVSVLNQSKKQRLLSPRCLSRSLPFVFQYRLAHSGKFTNFPLTDFLA